MAPSAAPTFSAEESTTYAGIVVVFGVLLCLCCAKIFHRYRRVRVAHDGHLIDGL